MDLREFFKTALASLRANRGRSILTSLGVVVGVSAVILLTSIGQGLKVYVTEQLGALGAETLYVIPGQIEFAPGGGGGPGIPGAGIAASKFKLTHQEDLEKAPSVAKAMAYSEFNGTISYKGKSQTTLILGVTVDYPQIRDQFPVQGNFFTLSQQNSARRVALLGKTTAKEIFGKEDPLGKKVTIADQRFTVLGVLEEKGRFGNLDLDEQILIPITTALSTFDQENVQGFWVKAKSADDVARASGQIEEILGRTLDRDDFSVLDTKTILSVVSSILGTLTLAVGGIAAISLIVGGIGIMNIMLVSVTERTREIGLRKAVGATPRDILIQFLTEAVVLSSLGGVIGIIVGAAGAVLAGRFLTTSISLWAIIVAFLVSALVGVIFGVIPARRAARLNPIDALRYE